MIRMNVKAKALVCACGTALGVSQLASAEPFLITISGATLLENLVRAPGTTNDWLDIDGDGTAGSLGSLFPDQLAEFANPLDPNGPADQRWVVQYSVVGSINGLQELIDYGRPESGAQQAAFPVSNGYVSTDDQGDITTVSRDAAYHNRNLYIDEGVSNDPIFNPTHPGGAPAVSSTDGTYVATLANIQDPPVGDKGISTDIAPVDVPGTWATRVPEGMSGDADFRRKPLQVGYGSNPRFSTNKDGTGALLDALLADLSGGANLFDSNNPGAADSNTLFDNQLAWAPIATITNLGTGRSEITVSELQHLKVTGRSHTGENYDAVTRDRGSGTRNGHDNTAGVDPSHGQGENIGPRSTLAELNLLGPNWVPGNSGGSSVMERKVRNHRLAIGYTGAERGVNRGWLTGGQIECLAVKDDLAGGATYHRPDINSILDNETPNAYRLGGPATLITFGDPRSSLMNINGAGPALGFEMGNMNPAMRNVHAAEYVNNITRSIENFIAVPAGDENIFMPGEVVAQQIIPPQALNARPDGLDPRAFIDQTAGTGDGLQNVNLKNQVLSISVLGNAAYATFGLASVNGLNPVREEGFTYSDGVVDGLNYVDQNGDPVSYGVAMQGPGGNLDPARNRISGDFNNDGMRNWNDSNCMIDAWRDRNGGPAWNGAGDLTACIEILGDFNGDGNFDAEDVRFWADGLAINPDTGNVDRAEGFRRVDAAFAGNFFGTALSAGASYDDGDSRGDVAGNGFFAPGFAPIGHDMMVDGDDISYVYEQFKQNPRVQDGSMEWSNLDESAPVIRADLSRVGGDLSADINGDLSINQADVAAIVCTILETNFGDVNLDGATDGTDSGIASGNLGVTPAAFGDGDVDGDGAVTQADVDIINDFACVGDADGNKTVNFGDVTAVLGSWLVVYEGPEKGAGDANGDCQVNFGDVTAVLGNWLASCP